MIDSGVTADEAIDWENLLENIPGDLGYDFFDDSASAEAAANGVSSFSINDIEKYLMNDESNSYQVADEDNDNLADGFFSELLLDLPDGPCLGSDSSASPESAVVEAEGVDREENTSDEKKGTQISESREENTSDEKEGTQISESKRIDVGGGEDTNDKKRKRQIRNRDAAVRSRERKKMLLRDLELKSKYYEVECKRLGNLLQCCLAENQALRLSLHNSKAFDASMTKQESAVLLLESLLLGSLLGFLGIICLLILHNQFLSNLGAALHTNVGSEKWESVILRKVVEAHKIRTFNLSMMGKRWKASRSRIRLKIIEFASCILCQTPRILLIH